MRYGRAHGPCVHVAFPAYELRTYVPPAVRPQRHLHKSPGELQTVRDGYNFPVGELTRTPHAAGRASGAERANNMVILRKSASIH